MTPRAEAHSLAVEPGVAAGFSIARRRHYGRYLAVLVAIGVFAFLVNAFARGQIDWDTVGAFLFNRTVLAGIVNTIYLTVAAMVMGIALGLISALMSTSVNPVLRYGAALYIFVFRSVPVLLQLLIWYNLALVFPRLSLFGYFSTPTTEVITPFIAALLAFGIMQGSYTSEVIRSGLLSVGKGQIEAAKAIGMPATQRMIHVVLPQAMRVIVPPIGNETIGMVKFTSLASVIQFKEVIYNAQTIYFANGRVIELLFVCTVWYMLIILVLSIAQNAIEKHYNKSTGKAAAKGQAK